MKSVDLSVEPVESLFETVKPPVVFIQTSVDSVKAPVVRIKPLVMSVQPSFKAVYPRPEALFNPLKVVFEVRLQMRDLGRHGEGDEFPELNEMLLHRLRLARHGGHPGFECRDSQSNRLFEVIRHARLRDGRRQSTIVLGHASPQ